MKLHLMHRSVEEERMRLKIFTENKAKVAGVLF